MWLKPTTDKSQHNPSATMSEPVLETFLPNTIVGIRKAISGSGKNNGEQRLSVLYQTQPTDSLNCHQSIEHKSVISLINLLNPGQLS